MPRVFYFEDLLWNRLAIYRFATSLLGRKESAPEVAGCVLVGNPPSWVFLAVSL